MIQGQISGASNNNAFNHLPQKQGSKCRTQSYGITQVDRETWQPPNQTFYPSPVSSTNTRLIQNQEGHYQFTVFKQFKIPQTVSRAGVPSYSGRPQLVTRRLRLPAATVDPAEVSVASSNLGIGPSAQQPKRSPLLSMAPPNKGAIASEQQARSGPGCVVASSTFQNGLGSADQSGTSEVLAALGILGADSQVLVPLSFQRRKTHSLPALIHCPLSTSLSATVSPSAESTTATIRDASSQVFPRPFVAAESKYARCTENVHQYRDNILNKPRNSPCLAENEGNLPGAHQEDLENTLAISCSNPSSAQPVTSECVTRENGNPPHPVVIMSVEEQQECQKPIVPAAEVNSHLLAASVAAERALEKTPQIVPVPPAEMAFQLGTMKNRLCVSPCTRLFRNFMCFQHGVCQWSKQSTYFDFPF